MWNRKTESKRAFHAQLRIPNLKLKKMYCANTNQKNAGGTILMSEKKYFTGRNITRARCDGTHLQSQQPRKWGRRITRLMWFTTTWTQNKSKKGWECNLVIECPWVQFPEQQQQQKWNITRDKNGHFIMIKGIRTLTIIKAVLEN